MGRRYKLRWRGVECVYGEREYGLVRELAGLAERGAIPPSQAAREWDFLQEMILELDASVVDAAAEPELYDDLLPIVTDGPFKVPDDVIAELTARRDG